MEPVADRDAIGAVTDELPVLVPEFDLIGLGGFKSADILQPSTNLALRTTELVGKMLMPHSPVPETSKSPLPPFFKGRNWDGGKLERCRQSVRRFFSPL